MPNQYTTPRIVLPEEVYAGIPGLPEYMESLGAVSQNVRELLREAFAKEYYSNTLLKQTALDDLFIFNQQVLGVEEDQKELGVFHDELCKFIEDDKKKKKLCLLPRGHLKSTLITIGYSVQQITKNPNIRILILNATWQLAVDFLTEIKRHLQQNERLYELFNDRLSLGSSLPKIADEWAQDRITLHRTDTNIKGPTVWATGIDSNLTGSHPDLIIMDDVVSRDNTQSREQIDKVILRYKDALDLLEPGGQLIVIGTRWREDDFYSWILDRDNTVRQNYRVMIKKAYEGDLETGIGLQTLWPAKFDQKELLSRKQEKGIYEFSAQYQNNPVPAEDADFKREWFQYYDIEEYRHSKMNSYLTVDPAISLKKEADYTALGVYGVDQFANVFIKDLQRGHWKPSSIIDAIFMMNEMWHPNGIVLETIAYQKALSYALQDEMRRRNRHLPIIEKQYYDKTKVERIRGLQPLYMNKKVFHRKDLKLNSYFEEELLTFPRSRFDDLIDTFSMALDFLVVPRVNREKRYHQQYLY